MLSVWINFRLDMRGLKMRALQRVVDFNSFKLVNLVFWKLGDKKKTTEKPHQVQVTISVTFN